MKKLNFDSLSVDKLIGYLIHFFTSDDSTIFFISSFSQIPYMGVK